MTSEVELQSVAIHVVQKCKGPTSHLRSLCGGRSMSNNWTSIKKNLRKKSSSAWNLKVKNPPHGKSGSSVDPANQLAAALANISHGTGYRFYSQTD